jgi:hypothetical protein
LHLFLLLAVVLVYVAFYAVTYVFTKKLVVSCVCWFPALAVLFLIFWIVRGCGSCNGCFPWFHYTTLLIELVFQIALLAIHIYFVCIYTKLTFDAETASTFGYIAYGLLAVHVLLYLFLVLKLVPVLTTLTCGAQSDKEELEKEAKGESATAHQPVAP